MTFGGFFSYLNTTIYGASIDANTDLRIETLPAAPGIAKVYFTDATVNFQLFFIKNNQYTVHCKFTFIFIILLIVAN